MTDYLQSAKFSSEETASAAYIAIQTLLHDNSDIDDLHDYRVIIEKNWYVIVLGRRPAHRYCQAIEQGLGQGTPVNLAKTHPQVVTMLSERNETLNSEFPPGGWFERHR